MIRFYTWRNELPKQPDLLNLTARQHGIRIENVGWGCPFKNLACKLDWLEEALSRLERRDLIVCTDSYDVLYAGTEQDIARAFHELGGEIVFAAERWYSHQEIQLKHVFDSLPAPFPYRYLNSGTLAGYAGAILDMLGAIAEQRQVYPNKGNDQWFIGKYFCEHPAAIKLDYECRLFWCTAGEWEAVHSLAMFENGRLRNASTGCYPSVVHVPWSKRYYHIISWLADQLHRRGDGDGERTVV